MKTLNLVLTTSGNSELNFNIAIILFINFYFKVINLHQISCENDV